MNKRHGTVSVNTTKILVGEVMGEFEFAKRDGEGQKLLDATAPVLSNSA